MRWTVLSRTAKQTTKTLNKILLTIGVFSSFALASLALSPHTYATPITVCDSSCDQASITAAVAAASPGSTISVGSGIYTETGQIVIDKDLTIVGSGIGTTTVRTNSDTGNTVDSKGWFLVNPGVNFNISELTLDGTGHKIYQAIRYNGSGTVDHVSFTNIAYEQSGPTYNGGGVRIGTSGNVDVTYSTFSNMGRYGLLAEGGTGTFSNNIYTGKGAGNWLDYGLDIEYGSHIAVSDNQISHNRGVATSDGSTSAAIAVWDDSGTHVTLTGNNVLTDNSAGIAIAVASGSTDPVVSIGSGTTFTSNNIGVDVQNAGATGSPTVIITGSTFSSNTMGINVPSGMTADNISVHNSIFSSNTSYSVNNGGLGTLNASNNYWGSAVASTVDARIHGLVTHTTYFVRSTGALDGTGTVNTAAPSTVYISGSYSDGSADGHSFGWDAFTTIQAGYDAVAAGGVVNIAAGTYEQGSTQISVSKSVTFQGPNASISPNGGTRVTEAIIHGSASGSTATFNITSSSAHVTFQGLKFENMGAAMRSDAPGATISLSKNIFTGNMSDGMGFDDPNLTVDDNLFTGIDTPNSDLIQLWVSHMPAVGTVSFTNSYFTSITSSGGLNLSDIHGTISGNHFNGVQYYGVLVNGNANLDIRDNIFDAITNPDSVSVPTWGAGIRFYDGTNPLTVASITGNTFSNSYLGISIKPAANISGATISAHTNKFISNTAAAILNAGTGTLDATNNYWGSADPNFASLINGSASHATWYVDENRTILSAAPASAPVLHAITSPTNNPRPTFAWDAVSAGPAVSSYHLVITNPDSSTTVIDQAGTSFTPGSNLSNGTYAWKVYAHNSIGNGSYSATGSFTIDATAPVIAAHANITVEATSAAGAIVAYTSPDVTDNFDAMAAASCTPASGSTFALGTTTVTCTKTDSAGNTATSTFTVTVRDTTAPVIAAHSNITVTSATATAVTFTAPTATDIVDGAAPAVCTPASSSTFALGTTTVTCTKTDAAGNTATSTFTVTVNPPVDTTHEVLLQPTTELSGSVTQVVVGGQTTSSTVNVPESVTNATLSVAAILTSTDGTKAATLAGDINVNATTSSGQVTVAIPAGITISGPTDWNGVINLPKVVTTTVTLPADSGFTATEVTSIEVGFGDVPLTFDQPVRLVFAGKAGKSVGWSRAGVFSLITANCTSDSASGMPAGANECKIDSGADLAVWTKHFTVFTTYAQKASGVLGETSGQALTSSASVEVVKAHIKWYWWLVIAAGTAVVAIISYNYGYRQAKAPKKNKK